MERKDSINIFGDKNIKSKNLRVRMSLLFPKILIMRKRILNLKVYLPCQIPTLV